MFLSNREKIKGFLEENILDRQAARAITGQSETAFNQSVNRKLIQPICSYGHGKAKINLYLKEEIINYSNSMKKPKEKEVNYEKNKVY